MIDANGVWMAVGLGLITLLTRCFFFILDRELPFPRWAQRGMPYAPIAALAAVVVPEIVMTQGQLIATWQDARLFAAAVGVAVFFWRRDVLLTILFGMVVYLPLHVGLGL